MLIGLAAGVFIFVYGQIRDYLPTGDETASYQMRRSSIGASVRTAAASEAEVARAEAINVPPAMLKKQRSTRPKEPKQKRHTVAAKPIKKNYRVVQRPPARAMPSYAGAPWTPWQPPPFGGY